MKSKIYTGLLLLFILFLQTVTSYAQKLLPMSIDDALSMLQIRPVPNTVSISPDSQFVAYTVWDRRKNEQTKAGFTKTGGPYGSSGCDIWITNIKTGETRNLTEEEGNSWTPVWSPNGKYLAFSSDRNDEPNLWLWIRETNSFRQVSNIITRFIDTYEPLRWTSDSSFLLAKVLGPNITLAQATKQLQSMVGLSKDESDQIKVFTHIQGETQNSLDKGGNPTSSISLGAYGKSLEADLALININDGSIRRIASNVRTQWYELSPDGNKIAYTFMKRYENSKTYQRLYDLYIYDLKSDQSKIVASDIQQMLDPFFSWSPDGRMLSYVTAGPLSKGDGYVVNIDGGEPVNLTEKFNQNLSVWMRAPVWDKEGKCLYFPVRDTLYKVSVSDKSTIALAKLQAEQILEIVKSPRNGHFWSPDSTSMLLMTRDNTTFNNGIYKINSTTGALTKLIDENKSYGNDPRFNMDVTNDGQVIYRSEDVQHSPDFWISNADFRSPRQLTNINPQFTKYIMGRSKIIEWQSIEGKTMHGALLLPANYREGEKYPLIVEIYGGSKLSRLVNDFGMTPVPNRNSQMLATRGYAILMADTEMIVGKPMKSIADSLLPGVNKLIESGIVDPNRIGVIGESFGGYSVMSLLVQTERFKAAVTISGVCEPLIHYLTMSKDGSKYYAMAWNEENVIGGSPWEYRERYIENSPLYYLDRITTPLLIAHGGDDNAFWAESIFVGLRRLDKDVTYAKYLGEGHLWREDSNRRDLLERIIGWFDQKLAKSSIVTKVE